LLFADHPLTDDPEAPEGQPVQLAAELMRILDQAEEEILIISAYLIPTDELEAAIGRAARRGVSVRLLTNSIQSNNHLVAHSAYRKHINALMHSGAQLHEVKTDARDRERHMLDPVDDKQLALHAKALVIDRDRVFIGSTNLDPRSLRINSEMGLLVESPPLNEALREAVLPDFDQANAWSLQFSKDGKVQWVSGDVVLDAQPAASFMQRLEDWFLSHLPLEKEL
jgi:putative cardiolipin synthase